MKITEVRLRLDNGANEKILARGSITIDDAFAIRDIKIVQKADGSVFVAMPSRVVGDPTAEKKTWRDVAHPVNEETRKIVYDAVIEKYNELVEEAE